MLKLLHIENIAVIEQADVELEQGLTVLSGETGAGKSILIDAVGAVLGCRVSRDLVRAGAQKGFVSAVFTELSAPLTALLEELSLSGDEADVLHIQRQITSDGKSSCRVNMKPVATAVLKTLAPYLINIHGQNDGQKLLDEQYHIDYLDGFAQNHTILAKYFPLYQQLLALKQEITALETDEQARLQRIDMLSFHKEEIEQAALQAGEEESLMQRKAFFDHAGKVSAALGAAQQLLAGDDELDGACALLDRASDALADIRTVSDTFDAIAERAQELRYLAADLKDGVAAQVDNSDFSQTEREQTERRLDEIYRLKQKYGSSVEEILLYYERIAEELDGLQNADNRRDTLREQYRETLASAKEVAAKLTAARRAAAKTLEARIINELRALDMDKVRLRIAVKTGSKLTAHGFDTVAFEISVNPGEPEKPLSKVASGGELSRIMLAMKTVLTANEDVGMLIFDEIDAGVSGHAAQQIARKLSAIAQQKQTLCVTHLPQIAAMGDHHLLISKTVRGARSYTDVQPMDERARIDEVARMISGEHITDTSRRNAAELLASAAEQRG